MAEGFLEITGITTQEGALEGEIVEQEMILKLSY